MRTGGGEGDESHLEEEEEDPVTPEEARGPEDGVEADTGADDHQLEVDVNDEE